MPSLRAIRALSLAALLVISVDLGRAQEESDTVGCFSRNVTVSTDRPTYSNATQTAQCGVMEVMGGMDRVWVGRGLHQDDVVQALQFGLTPSMDLHYSGNLYFGDGTHSGSLSGVSDSYAGVRYRLTQQTHSVPSFGLFYTVKVPTASPLFGMSTGRYDHFLSFLVSKDLPKVHLDFNVTEQMEGRPGAAGHDYNDAYVLFATVPLSKRLSLLGGGYGFRALNAAAPAYAVTSVGFDYQVNQRLILDVSIDEGVTSGAPRKRLGFGFTYAYANAYRIFSHPQERTW
ncbi:transporter [Granulicella sibirica]|nr:transporter [Granulicella sibirica]